MNCRTGCLAVLSCDSEGIRIPVAGKPVAVRIQALPVALRSPCFQECGLRPVCPAIPGAGTIEPFLVELARTAVDRFADFVRCRERVGNDVGFRSVRTDRQILRLDDPKGLSLALKPVAVAFDGLARANRFKVLLVRNDGTVDVT